MDGECGELDYDSKVDRQDGRKRIIGNHNWSSYFGIPISYE